MDKATFGAGCFWHVEAAFREIPGVTGTRVGYAGGQVDDPSYEEVCSHRTGHAEVVEVEFDPEQVSYGHLLAEFWTMHDPTQLNRQGPDIGANYRSIIIAHDDDQRALAEASKVALAERSPRPIVTEIIGEVSFWPAEDYHQQYFEKKGISSCAVTVMNPVG
ncbi:MAG: peptide-methionine (S)-S-oxide reductase MsrA [Actinobacteria bacterium]|nr:peptide-methionine (S)-S-oxide reductase MsrA [Actinomycetota bacterium]